MGLMMDQSYETEMGKRWPLSAMNGDQKCWPR